MEITPTVLLGLGRTPAMALVRFKVESAWRPAPVRQAIRAVFLGARPPAPGSGLALTMEQAAVRECHWLAPAEEPWGSAPRLRETLLQAWEAALACRTLEAVRDWPGYGARVREHHEWFAPEVCLLADAAEVGGASLGLLISHLARGYRRPISVVLTLPAPKDEPWPRAQDVVHRALHDHGPDLLARLWLVSRERETGELLDATDLADALAHFCHLFAHSGWPANPGLSRLLLPPAGAGGAGRLATFGVRARRFPAVAARVAGAWEEAVGRVERQLGDPAAAGPLRAEALLSGALDRGQRAALALVPSLPAPGLADGDLAGSLAAWQGEVETAWAPVAAAPVAAAVRRSLAPLLDRAADPGLAPLARLRRLEELDRALRGALARAQAPPELPDLAPAAGRLAAARRRRPRWFPLSLLGGREQARAAAALQAAAGAWAGARARQLVHDQARAQLEALAREVRLRLDQAAAAVDRLQEERAALGPGAPELPPNATAVTVPAPGAPVAEAAPADARPIPLLLPVRAIHPATGEPLRTAPVVVADPFTHIRFAIAPALALQASARTELVGAGRGA